MIDTLPSGGLRIRVYAGVDPLSKCRHDLTEVIPAGPNAAREAERAGTRLLNQVDERRNPRTRATVNQLLDRWLDVLDVEPSTRRGYVLKMDTWSALSANAAILIYRQTEQAEDVAELAGTERVTEGGADYNTDNTRRLLRRVGSSARGEARERVGGVLGVSVVSRLALPAAEYSVRQPGCGGPFPIGALPIDGHWGSRSAAPRRSAPTG